MAEGAGEPGRQARQVQQREEILLLLNRAREMVSPIEVRVRTLQGLGPSILLEIDARSGQLQLDAALPGLLQPALLDGENAWLSTRLDGAELDWRGSLQLIANAPGGPCFATPLPQSLRYLQRRNAFRLQLPIPLRQRSLQLRWDEQERAGELLDLSRLGAGTRIAGVPPRLVIGSPLMCRFKLPGLSLAAPAEVRSAVRELRATRLGMRFLDLNSTQDETLASAVFALHRMSLRQRMDRTAAPASQYRPSATEDSGSILQPRNR